MLCIRITFSFTVQEIKTLTQTVLFSSLKRVMRFFFVDTAETDTRSCPLALNPCLSQLPTAQKTTNAINKDKKQGGTPPIPTWNSPDNTKSSAALDLATLSRTWVDFSTGTQKFLTIKQQVESWKINRQLRVLRTSFFELLGMCWNKANWFKAANLVVLFICSPKFT